MLLPQPMARGRLLQRYKRFFADVLLDDGRQIVAHCPNPGAMLGLNTPGLTAWVSPADGPKRKLAWTLELVEADGGLVGINTLHPNRLVAEALAAGAIPELAGYAVHRREVKFAAASRVDFLLTGPDRPDCYLEINDHQSQLQRAGRVWVEVKGVTLHRGNGLAEWPDCVSTRAVRHLTELTAKAATGDRAVVLFVVQRNDCSAFKACHDLDPMFAAELDRAADAEVEVLVYTCKVAAGEIRIANRIPWMH